MGTSTKVGGRDARRVWHGLALAKGGRSPASGRSAMRRGRLGRAAGATRSRPDARPNVETSRAPSHRTDVLMRRVRGECATKCARTRAESYSRLLSREVVRLRLRFLRRHAQRRRWVVVGSGSSSRPGPASARRVKVVGQLLSSLKLCRKDASRKDVEIFNVSSSNLLEVEMHALLARTGDQPLISAQRSAVTPSSIPWGEGGRGAWWVGHART